MGQITTIGLDIAKSVFQVHGVDAEGVIVLRRRLTRARLLEFFGKIGPCRVGIEAAPPRTTGRENFGRSGHDVRLMPPSYVKPYVKRQKNDAADAEAICEAVTRPTMRFVEVEDAGAAERHGAASDAADADAPAHPALQRHPRPHGGVRHRRADRPEGPGEAA